MLPLLFKGLFESRTFVYALVETISKQLENIAKSHIAMQTILF